MMQRRTAKAIFMQYGGSHMQMWLEGDDAEYKSHGISETVENEWIGEHRSQLVVKFVRNPENADPLIEYFQTNEYSFTADSLQLVARAVADNRGRMDSFGKLLYAEQVAGILEESKECPDTLPIIRLALDLLDDVIANPRKIGEYYKSLGHINEILQEGGLLERASQCQVELTEGLRRIT